MRQEKETQGMRHKKKEKLGVRQRMSHKREIEGCVVKTKPDQQIRSFARKLWKGRVFRNILEYFRCVQLNYIMAELNVTGRAYSKWITRKEFARLTKQIW